MRKLLLLATVVFATAILVPVTALAAGPIDAVKADIAKLQSDVQSKHDTVLADAAKLESDAKALVGTTDKAAARATIKIDALKLTGDWKSLLSVCLADRLQLRQDIAAARHANGGDKGELRLLVRQANLQIRASNLEMRAGVARARAAVVALRLSFKGQGEQAPVVPTPPTTTK